MLESLLGRRSGELIYHRDHEDYRGGNGACSVLPVGDSIDRVGAQAAVDADGPWLGGVGECADIGRGGFAKRVDVGVGVEREAGAARGAFGVEANIDGFVKVVGDGAEDGVGEYVVSGVAG